MPPRSEALIWARKDDSRSSEAATEGYYYLYWLSHGRFGSTQQIQHAKDYVASYERIGVFGFGRSREWDAVREATFRYFALLDEYLPVETRS